MTIMYLKQIEREGERERGREGERERGREGERERGREGERERDYTTKGDDMREWVYFPDLLITFLKKGLWQMCRVWRIT